MVGAKNMIRYIYSDDIASYVYEHENKMTDVYLSIINSYQTKFEKYKCNIVLEKYWYNLLDNCVSSERIPFSNGYTCAFSCSIERDGKMVCVDELEGNMLTVSWTISYISKEWSINPLKKLQLVISMFDDVEEAILDLDGFLQLIDDMESI